MYCAAPPREHHHPFCYAQERLATFACQCGCPQGREEGRQRRAHHPHPLPAPSDPLGVDVPPNPADRLKRANQEEALRRCDFSDPESINEHYPAYVGKGTFNCPLSWINAATTKRGKARIIFDWRMLTLKQQKEKLDAIYDNQLVLREGLVSGVSNVDRMLAQPSSHKKRRT